MLYRNLARHFGNEFSFYGLQSQGLDGNDAPLTTVEQMAERYLGEIRKVQLQGPYFVGGYCLGGTIAYEIAQRLRRDGHEVALVALMDTYNFARMKRPVPFRFLCQKVAFHWGNMRRLPLLEWPGYLFHKMSVARAGEFSSLWRILRGSVRPRPTAARLRSLHESVHDVNERAAQFYQPKPYAGRVTCSSRMLTMTFTRIGRWVGAIWSPVLSRLSNCPLIRMPCWLNPMCNLSPIA